MTTTSHSQRFAPHTLTQEQELAAYLDQCHRLIHEMSDPNIAHLTLVRIHFTPDATLGRLYFNDQFFCHTLEPCARAKDEAKVPGKTAIPEGLYPVNLETISPRFSNFRRYPWARPCNGKLPRLYNVPGFNGVLIHVGNTPEDTEGCILVGEVKSSEMLINSAATFRRLMLRLQNHPRHIPLILHVRRKRNTEVLGTTLQLCDEE